MNKQEAKQDKKQCITPSYENFMAGGNTDDEKAWFELGYKAASKTVAEQEKSMEDIDLKTAAVNYVTEKHNKQAGDVWYDENESDAQSFIAGFQYAALQTASLTRQNEDLKSWVEKLENALQPLACLSLVGVTGAIVYQRDNTKILVADVRNAKQALSQTTYTDKTEKK